MRLLTLFLIALFLAGCTVKQQKTGVAAINAPYTPPATAAEKIEDVLGNSTILANTTGAASPAIQDNANNSTSSLFPPKNYTLAVYYFFSPYCIASMAIQPEIEKLEARYNDSVLFVKYNITEPAAFAEYNKFAIAYNLSNKSRLSPLAYVGDRVLIGRFEINDSLELLIKAGIKQD